MGMSVSPQIWQQFVDLVFQDNLIKHKQNFDIIMDDTFIHSTAEEHMGDLLDLFKVLQKYGLKISPHKCQFFKKKIVYVVPPGFEDDPMEARTFDASSKEVGWL